MRNAECGMRNAESSFVKASPVALWAMGDRTEDRCRMQKSTRLVLCAALILNVVLVGTALAAVDPAGKVVALEGAGRSIDPTQALSLVYGYAVGVDLTRRDLQAAAKKAGRPWTTAKGFDHSAPLSLLQPVVAGGHPAAAEISLEVNGEPRQQGSTADMTWSVPEIIAELSKYFELRAGDLIFTGTPPGVGPLSPGDVVACEIEGIGRLGFRLQES